MITQDSKLVEVCKLPGIRDLPMRVRGYFAKALIAEAAGNHAEAATLLDKAIENEDS
jgi:hypothetical protein